MLLITLRLSNRSLALESIDRSQNSAALSIICILVTGRPRIQYREIRWVELKQFIKIVLLQRRDLHARLRNKVTYSVI